MGAVVKSLVDQVRDTLVDKAGGLYLERDIAEFIYQGELAVAYLRPDELSFETDFRLAARTRQALPAGGIRLREVLHNRGRDDQLADGAPIRLVDRGVIDAFVNWRAMPAGRVVEEYMYDERNPKQFDISPPMTDGDSYIRIYYEGEPPKYTYDANGLVAPNTQQTTVSAKYGPVLIEWALFRALSRQDDLTQAQIDGGQHWSNFFQMLGVSVQSDAAASVKRRFQLE